MMRLNSVLVLIEKRALYMRCDVIKPKSFPSQYTQGWRIVMKSGYEEWL